MGGLRDGLVNSAVAASAVGKEPQFCIPRTVRSISAQEFMGMIDSSLRNWTITSEPPPPSEELGMVAILVLRERFPCRR
jgi:hypothetical protein